MAVGGGEPACEFCGVGQFGIVGVVAVEEGDTFDVVGDFGEAINISEGETAAAAVAGKDEAEVARGGEAFAEILNDGGNAGVVGIVLAAPRRPGFFGAFKVSDDDLDLAGLFTEPAGLGADVLDVEMPVVAGIHFVTEGLFDGVSVGERVEDEANGLVRLKGIGGVDHDANAGVDAKFGYAFAKKIGVTGQRQRAFVAEVGRECGVGEDGFEARFLAVDFGDARDEADAVTVIDPFVGVAEVKELDGFVVGFMPSVDRDFAGGFGEAARDDDVLFVACGEGMLVLANELVMLREDADGGHGGAGRDGSRREFQRGSGINFVNHFWRWQQAIQFVGQELGGVGREGREEIIRVGTDSEIIGRDQIFDGAGFDGNEFAPKIRDVAAQDFVAEPRFAVKQIEVADLGDEFAAAGGVGGARRQLNFTGEGWAEVCGQE